MRNLTSGNSRMSKGSLVRRKNGYSDEKCKGCATWFKSFPKKKVYVLSCQNVINRINKYGLKTKATVELNDFLCAYCEMDSYRKEKRERDIRNRRSVQNGTDK
ncbi:unnamed protein product [Brachionus calyciflorus]|uniref:Uncharacterized protein n=1 Tax=Brachionus calyciflorus TaxID=104777 RepID=A0A814JFI9_9BILA|nr:unnamed protein product [Brachionus calyciflorus]